MSILIKFIPRTANVLTAKLQFFSELIQFIKNVYKSNDKEHFAFNLKKNFCFCFAFEKKAFGLDHIKV